MADHLAWHVKNEAILDELISLIGLSNEERLSLTGLAAEASRVAPDLTAAFYRRLLNHAPTAEFLQDVALDRQHQMVGQWFVELFSGRYDSEYVRKRLIIGEIHVRIGLPVRYPLAMLDLVLPFGEQVARTSTRPDVAVPAFRKLLGLDVAIFNQAYEDNQLKHLAELVGGERLARLLLAGLG